VVGGNGNGVGHGAPGTVNWSRSYQLLPIPVSLLLRLASAHYIATPPQAACQNTRNDCDR
jgi:hypothetical protein